MPDDLAFLDAHDQAALVRTGDATPAELVDSAIARIEKLDGELNAVIHPRFDEARAEAGAPPAGEAPFRGVPCVVKDLDGTLAGAPYHAGNRLLRDLGHVAETTSFLFARLQAAGFVIVGKTNTPELGLMPTTEPLAYGPTRNPWQTAHSTGGSSGGSAAAVASGMVAVGHAGDGGGSIRIPAAHCGLVGLKPSRGRTPLGPPEGEAWSGFVSRHVVTRSVRDTAAVLDAVHGAVPGDPYTAPPPARPFAAEVGADPGRLRIGLRTHAPAGQAETDPECAAAAEDAARLLESLGHHVEEASPAALDDPVLTDAFMTVLIGSTEADLRDLARIAGREIGPDDVEPATWMYAEMARDFSAGAYVLALRQAHEWSRRVVSWWAGGFDLLLTPTCAEPPPVLGDLVPSADDPLHGPARALPYVTYTAPFNVTGQPAISVPLYWAASNLPIGVHLVAAPYREDVLLRVAAQLEAARPWGGRRPTVHA